jgi:hypothetical protein
LNPELPDSLDVDVMTGSVALDVVTRIISQGPEPKVRTETAGRCAEAIGLHLTMLIMVASDANLRGRHSCAVALFRGMEDALDCFAAVSLMADAAEKWARGDLRASDAARLWEDEHGDFTLPIGEKAIDYRKGLREYFNNFAHCSFHLTDWNVYPELDPTDEVKLALRPDQEHTLAVRFRVNHEQKMLQQNAIRIGAYLAAHTVEFISVVEMAYERFLTQNPDMKRQLSRSKHDLENVLKKGLGAVYLEDRPPELEQLVLRDPAHPELVQLIPLLKHNEDDATADNSG